MRNTLNIAVRELNSFFFSPIAYVVLAVFALLAGLFFLTGTFVPGQEADLRVLMFYYLIWVLVAVAPAISMRLLSEELRSGHIEALMTSPVTDVQVIAGKWLGGLAFYAVMLLPTAVFVALLGMFASPNYAQIAVGYLGLMLVGGLFMAIGVLASSLTRDQIIAFLITVAMILLLTAMPYSFESPFVRSSLPEEMVAALIYVNLHRRFEPFSAGIVDTSNLVYFLSGAAFFLLLAVKSLETRKWR